MVVFYSRSASAHAATDDLCGCTAIPQDPRFEVRELGEIDMVSRARAMLDLVTHDDAWPAFLAAHLAGLTVLSYGELAGLNGGSERILRQDSKALALRDYPARDAAPRFVARSLRVWRASRNAVRDRRPSPFTGPVDVFGPPIMDLPATAVQRRHECGTGGQLAGALRELIADQR
jgi:hypothetical protein